MDPPPAASVVLGRAPTPELLRFVDLLAGPGIERGLLGPREADRLWDRHVLNCVVVERLLPQGSRIADLGSGAGLPGIVLALARPDLSVVLVEPLLRRATFLSEAIETLGLADRVEVVRTRAEDYAGDRVAIITARAVAPLDRLARIAAPLLSSPGTLLALKGERADAELVAHRDALAQAGVTSGRVEVLGADVLEEPTRVVVLEFGSS